MYLFFLYSLVVSASFFRARCVASFASDKAKP